MKDKLKIALSSFKWISIIGMFLFIINAHFDFWGDDIMFVIIIMIISLLVLIYYAAKYLIELGNEVEDIKRNSNK
jgi:hypothetical protein